MKVLALLLSMIIGLWKFLTGKRQEKIKQAEQGGKDLEDAKKNDSESSFLDGFGRL